LLVRPQAIEFLGSPESDPALAEQLAYRAPSKSNAEYTADIRRLPIPLNTVYGLVDR
jgi:hypothetical protein